MSGRYANGFDWLATGASNATILAALVIEGWYPVTPPTSEIATSGASPVALTGMSVQVPGRFNYGKRLAFNQSGAVHAGPTTFYTGASLVRPVEGTPGADGFISCGLNIPSDCTQRPFLGVFDGVDNVWLVIVTFDANGVIRVYRGNESTGTQIGATIAGQYLRDTDFDVEIYFKVHPTAGEVQVKIDTTSVLHLINVDTQRASVGTFDSYGFGFAEYQFSGSNLADFSIDDLRYYDTAGAINNAFLGLRRVQTSFVAGNGATIDFTRSNTGLANWQNLLNLAIDDTLYLYDPTVGDFNLSTIQPLVNNPDIAWIQVTGFYRQDDATQRYVKNRIVSAGSTGDGASTPITQTYSAVESTFELDPNTGLQFTATAYNALQIGPLIFA